MIKAMKRGWRWGNSDGVNTERQMLKTACLPQKQFTAV